MESENYQRSLHAVPSSRPVTAPDFLLSRSTGSVRSRGVRQSFSSLHSASRAIQNHEVAMVVGAIPFRNNTRPALIEPAQVVHIPHPSEPPAYFRGTSLRGHVMRYSPTATEHRNRVRQALQAIDSGEIDKIVLARNVRITGDDFLDPHLIAARLLDGSPQQEAYLMDLSPSGPSFEHHWLVGSSPELLVSLTDGVVRCHPLAGSRPRGLTPQEDEAIGQELLSSAKDLREHQYVVEAILSALDPLCLTLSAPSSPTLTSTKEMWHLGTPIEGRLLDERSLTVLDLVQLLHPTPAVGGWPRNPALDFIRHYEDDRRFYAGAVGWCDLFGNGEWVVTIRCAEINTYRNTACAWAGGGIVAGSDPDAEVQETRDKLRTMLRALSLSGE